MLRVSLLLVSCALIALVHGSDAGQQAADFIALVEHWGYPIEMHNVTTEDGYILEVFRIPHGRNTNGVNAKVMLYQHGLLDQCSTAAENQPSESLMYLAADAGYDVWMVNSRGNTFGLNHLWLKPTEPAFWNFSWDHMAIYDVPAFVHYALDTNGQASQLTYVGHSQGTMIALAHFSTNATTAALVNYAVLLAPVAYLSHVKAGLGLVAEVPTVVFEDFFGTEAFLANSAAFDEVSYWFCKLDASTCDSFACFLFGCQNSDNYNSSLIDLYSSHDPAGTSIMNMLHYKQAIESGNFQRFDWGSAAANQAAYGTSTPPLWPVANMMVNTITVRGGQDTMADPTDVAHLLTLIPKPALDISVPAWGHIDPILGIDAAKQAYVPILEFLEAHNA